MYLTIIYAIILIIGLSLLLSYFATRKKIKEDRPYYTINDSWIGIWGVSILVVLGIVILITTFCVLATFSQANENYNKMVATREGLEFTINHLDIYTDNFEYHNSDIINEVREFNTNLAKQKATSHNPFTGWFIPDYADDIEPIDYKTIAKSYSGKRSIVVDVNLLNS